MKIVALPFAGGSKYSYRELEKYVPDQIQWINIELPGRATRINEQLNFDIKFLIDDIYELIKSEVGYSEYIIYGHSMGSLLGYEVVKKITNSNFANPKLLFFTGRGAPDKAKILRISGEKKEKFWKQVYSIGGLPESIMDNKEFKNFLEPIFRNDFKLVEDYVYEPPETPFSIPIFIRVGEKEDSSTLKTAFDWQKETIFPLDLKKMKGGHFFIFDSPQEIVNEIVIALTKVQSNR